MKHSEKKARQDALIRLVMQEAIPTQYALQKKMAELGFDVTQATLSRDIRELNISKARRSGKRACYTVFEKKSNTIPMTDMIQNASLRTDFAGNIAVIHCRSGTAPAICVALDALHREDVVGTIAGDDTVFVLLYTTQQARDFAISYARAMEKQEGFDANRTGN